MGWIGTTTQVRHYLSIVGADRLDDGSYRLEGDVFLGIDPEECLVGDGARYFTRGKPCNLAAGLSGTSYGLAVGVVV